MLKRTNRSIVKLDLLEGQAASSEWSATWMTRSSTEKQLRAIKIPVNTANESCMDKSLT